MDKKAVILDIAMNLNRVGNWAVDNFPAKEKRIYFFVDQTNRYIDSLNVSAFSDKFRKTLHRFLEEYRLLNKKIGLNSEDGKVWGEKMITWGNILTHRSKLI